MKKLLILLVINALSFQLISAVEENHNNAAQALINHLKGIEQGFCGKSWLTSNIRSDSGKLCKTLLGASLAAEVCLENNKDNFLESQCHDEMVKVFRKNVITTTLNDDDITQRSWSEIDDPQSNKTITFKSIAFVISQHGAKKVCSFINSFSLFIGFSESDCVKNLKAHLKLIKVE